jgi:hypothetical protein
MTEPGVKLYPHGFPLTPVITGGDVGVGTTGAVVGAAGADVGTTTGTDVGIAVGITVGLGVGLGVDFTVGLGVGLGVGVAFLTTCFTAIVGRGVWVVGVEGVALADALAAKMIRKNRLTITPTIMATVGLCDFVGV